MDHPQETQYSKFKRIKPPSSQSTHQSDINSQHHQIAKANKLRLQYLLEHLKEIISTINKNTELLHLYSSENAAESLSKNYTELKAKLEVEHEEKVNAYLSKLREKGDEMVKDNQLIESAFVEEKEYYWRKWTEWQREKALRGIQNVNKSFRLIESSKQSIIDYYEAFLGKQVPLVSKISLDVPQKSSVKQHCGDRIMDESSEDLVGHDNSKNKPKKSSLKNTSKNKNMVNWTNNTKERNGNLSKSKNKQKGTNVAVAVGLVAGSGAGAGAGAGNDSDKAQDTPTIKDTIKETINIKDTPKNPAITNDRAKHTTIPKETVTTKDKNTAKDTVATSTSAKCINIKKRSLNKNKSTTCTNPTNKSTNITPVEVKSPISPNKKMDITAVKSPLHWSMVNNRHKNNNNGAKIIAPTNKSANNPKTHPDKPTKTPNNNNYSNIATVDVTVRQVTGSKSKKELKPGK